MRKIRVIAQFNLANSKFPLEYNQRFKVLSVRKSVELKDSKFQILHELLPE